MFRCSVYLMVFKSPQTTVFEIVRATHLRYIYVPKNLQSKSKANKGGVLFIINRLALASSGLSKHNVQYRIFAFLQAHL